MMKLARVASVLTVSAVSAFAGAGTSGAQASQGVGESPIALAARARPQPGDRIFLHVLRERELSDTVFVNERGEAAFPKLGLLQVSSMTITELVDTLRARYAQYLRTPELEIAVLRRVLVNGEVARPNVYFAELSSSVADLIARAGGFTDAANRGKIFVVREGERQRIRDWDRGGAIAALLQSGDEIVVARRNWWVLNALPAVSTATIVASLVISLRR